jgi:anti-sigma B factor antagonist
MAEMALVICEEDLGIEVSYLAGGVEVALRGELDLATASALHEYLCDLVTQGWTDIALDIAELRFIDATGLSLITMTQKRVTQMGGSLVVRHPTPSALTLFGATGLTEILMGAECSRTRGVGLLLQHI